MPGRVPASLAEAVPAKEPGLLWRLVAVNHAPHVNKSDVATRHRDSNRTGHPGQRLR